MKKIAEDWLRSAQLDLDNISKIFNDEHLTPVTAFHSQQAIEKSLKALMEENQIEFRKTHDLIYLHKIIMKHFELKVDIGILRAINELYIDSRYPGELGLLPYGNPTLKDAKQFYDFAKEIFDDVNAFLKDKSQDTHDEDNKENII